MSDLLKEYRTKYPQYSDLSDDQLTSALHQKYNNDQGSSVSIEEFNAAIGYVPTVAPPEEEQNSGFIDSAQTFLFGEGGTEPEAEIVEEEGGTVSNWLKGAGERIGDLGSGLYTVLQAAENDAHERRMKTLPEDEQVKAKARHEKAQETLTNYERELKAVDYGYKERVGWQDVQKSLKENGALSGTTIANVFEFGAEQGVKSVPDMVATMYAMPVYILARSGEIGDIRAKNKGKEKADITDVLEAAPFAAASALLERVGAKGMTSDIVEGVGKELLEAGVKQVIKRTFLNGGKALVKEAATEAIQEGMIEYAGEKFGTDAQMSFAEALDRAAAGAVAGGVFGGAVGTGTSLAGEIVNNPEAAFQADVDAAIDGSEYIVPAEDVAIETLKPREEMTMAELVKDYAEPEIDPVIETPPAVIDETEEKEEKVNPFLPNGIERDGPQTREEILSKASKYYEKTKAPLINIIRQNGGVKVGSELASELGHMGINSKTHPGLFKKGKGMEALDTILVEEYDILEDAPTQSDNGEVDRDWLLEKIADEHAGNKYYPPYVQNELDAINEEEIQEQLYQRQLEQEANAEIDEVDLDIDEGIIEEYTGFIEGLDDAGFEWEPRETEQTTQNTQANPFEPDDPPFETSGSSENRSENEGSIEKVAEQSSVEPETAKTNFTPIEQKVSDIYKKILANNPREGDKPSIWHDQMEEIIDNPQRFHSAQEIENDKNIKIGDEVEVLSGSEKDARKGIVVTMLPTGKTLSVKVQGEKDYGGFVGIEYVQKIDTEARTEPKAETEATDTKKTETVKTDLKDQQGDIFGGITAKDQKGFAEKQSQTRKKSTKKQNDDAGELFDTESRKQTDIEDAPTKSKKKDVPLDDVEVFSDKLKKDLGLKTLSLYKSKNKLKLDVIIVNKVSRKSGIGTKAMERITDFADKNNLKIVLSPALKDDFQGTSSRSRLVKFYKRFGFVENKGRNKDFEISESMYREPIEQKQATSKKYSLDQFTAFKKSLAEETATVETILADAKNLIENKERVLKELATLKKADLVPIAQSMRNDLNKPDLIKEAYNTMLRAHVMGSSVMTIFGGSKTFEEQIIEQIENQTQKDVDSQYEEQAKYRAERKKRLELAKKSISNPETLEEFNYFIRFKGKDAFTPEQLAAYDELVSEKIAKDKPKTEVIKGDTGDIKTERAQTVHSKSGIDLYVVKLVDRVDRDKFKELSSKAKKLGGYYSRYSKDGAIPGYQFKTSEDADAFESFLRGEDVDRSSTTEAKKDVKNAKNAQKLLDMADKIEAKAEEEINRPRQTNTGKRASQAASSIDAAQKRLALAKTIREIGIRLQSGDLKHLSNITQVTQLEDLMSIQRQAIPNSFFESDYDGYGMSYNLKDDVDINDYIGNVLFPELYVHSENMTRTAEKIKDKRGFKNVARDIRRLPVYRDKSHLRVLDQKTYEKLQSAIKRGYIDEYDLGGFTGDMQKTIKRLKRLGIETDEQLRAAIRELDTFVVKKKKADPIVKLEAELIGKKIPGFFPTPKPLVEKMIDYADIQEGQEVLEPSAGKGDIANEIKITSPNAELSVIEFNSNLNEILKAKGFNVVGNDFLEHKAKYDRIIMNPPFEKFQDIDHVRHAYDLLKPGGKLVAIMGAGVKNSRKKAVEFREWVDNQGSYIEDLPEGSFKSGDVPTGTSTVMVVLDKPDVNTSERKKNDIHYSQRPENAPNVLNAPGHNYIGLHRSLGIPTRREVVTIGDKQVRVPDAPQRIEPIMGKLVEIMGRRIYFGKIKGKSKEGFYIRDHGEIRTRKKNDVEVLAHEMAHYLDFYSNVSLPDFRNLYMDDRYIDEVRSLSYTDNPQIYESEGFAEFVRLFLTNDTEARWRAPNFYKAFSTLLARDKKLNVNMRSLQEQMHKFYFQGPDKLGQALIGKDMAFSQRFNEWSYRRDSRIRQQTIDKFHAANIMEKELTGKIGKVQESAWKQFRLANGGSEGIAEYILNYGTLNFDERGDLQPTGKSLHDVFAPVKTIKRNAKHANDAPIDLLMRYFAGRRALELHRQGRENLIPIETAKEWARLGGEYRVFETIHKEYQEFNDRMMDFYEDAGMITPESRAVMQSMNKDYVPFNRIRDQLAGNGQSPSAGFKRLKGGTANLNDILVNIQDGIVANVRSALNNKAKQRLYEYVSNHRDGAIFATKIGPDSRPVKVYEAEMMGKVSKILEANGIELDGDLNLDSPELLTFWQHGIKPTLNESGNMVDTVIINGKPKFFEVQDPLLQDMLLSMNPESYSSFMNVMFGIKNFFTRSITLGVEFTMANLVRDTVGASTISKEGFIPFYDSFKGFYSFLAKDEHYQAFMRSGGGYSSRMEAITKEGTARRRVKLEEFGVMSVAERLLSSIDNIASAFEYGTRIGEFRVAKKNNRSDMDAAFEAREISTDFSVMGANHFLTGFIRTIPFLNAMIQSQDRVYRGAFFKKKYDGNPTAIAMKAFLGISLPTLALFLINKDDEEYQKIPDYEKRTNWHIPRGDGRFIKIPRPYDVGFVFGTMPELFFKYLEDEKGKEFSDGMLWTLTQMYGVDATPALMTGWWDLVRNEKWTGAPVIPSALAEVSAPEQYTAYTSETFIRLGQALGISPVKAEHMFKAYTGYLGGYLLSMTDYMMWDEEAQGERPEKDPSESVYLRRFLTPKTRYNTKQQEKFFELYDKSKEIVATFKAKIDERRALSGKKLTGVPFKGDKFMGLSAEEKKALFALNDSMNDLIKIVYGREGIKTAEIATRNDKNLSGAEKRKKLDEYARSRNDAFMKYYKAAEKALNEARDKTKQKESK